MNSRNIEVLFVQQILNSKAIRILTIGMIVFLNIISSHAQTVLNIEFQAYPTGIIPGIRVENKVNDKTDVHLRIGVNIFDHRDLGVHMLESGKGIGFTLGVARYLPSSKFSLGLKNDLWFNKVNWYDWTVSGRSEGETKITVLQPTAEIAYLINTKRLSVRPSLAFGLEWNVITNGEPTGEGPIILVGIIIGKRKNQFNTSKSKF